MTSLGRPSRRLLLAVAWAVVGVLGGHLLTYALLFPDAHVHDAVLQGSGHGWMALLWPAALTASVVAVGLGALSGSGRAGTRGVRFTVLVLLQVALFGGLELGERVAAGMTLETLPHQLTGHGLAAILVVGSLVQVLTAWLGSAASRLVAAVTGRPRRAAPRRRVAHPRLLPPPITPAATRPVRVHGSRGPPSRPMPALTSP